MKHNNTSSKTIIDHKYLSPTKKETKKGIDNKTGTKLFKMHACMHIDLLEACLKITQETCHKIQIKGTCLEGKVLHQVC